LAHAVIARFVALFASHPKCRLHYPLMARTQSVVSTLVFLVILLTGITGSLACSVIAVGKDASATGHPMVAHTDDSGPGTTDFRFTRVPRQHWPEGSLRPFYHWVDGYPRVVAAKVSPEYAPVGDQKETVPTGFIPQVPETFAYWDMDYGVQNEKGLSIGESTCTSKTVGWPATPEMPYGYNRAGIEDLSKIAMERCATARCAITTMGQIAVDEGFFSSDSGKPEAPDFSDSAEALAIADGLGELWIFNVMTGRNNASAIWAAKRVPPGDVAAIGNSFTIRKMNLSDPDNFLYSPGVTKLAEEMGWWSPSEEATPGVFDFFGSYGFTPPKPLPSGQDSHTTPGAPAPQSAELLENLLSFYSGRRMWRIFSLLSPKEGAKLDPNKGNLPKTENPYPSSVPAPKGSVTPEMVMNVLRDHYEGTPYDLTKGVSAGPFGSPNRGPVTPHGVSGLWERAISLERGSWSYVLEANPHGRSVSWLGLDAPHGAAYLPFYGAAASSAPESFREGMMSKFSTKAAWWAFNLVNQYSDMRFSLINPEVRNRSHAIEVEAASRRVAWEAEADAAAAIGGEAAALKLLTERSNAFAQAKVDEWWDFAWSLFAKYGRSMTTQNESENGAQLQVYPAWWLQSPEVGFTEWSVNGPFHGKTLKAQAETVDASAPWGMSPILAGASAVAVCFIVFQAGVQQGVRKRSDDLSGYVAQP